MELVYLSQLARSMREELQDLDVKPIPGWHRSTIQRVLPRLREGDSSAYDPKLVSIGPFHRDNPALRAMEVHKWRYLRDLLARRPVNKLENCVVVVGFRIDEIRAQYSEKFEYITDGDFVRMTVLDGCFILELLVKLYDKEDDPTLPAMMSHLWMDLLLLENQIPYFVMENLFEVLGGKSDPPLGPGEPVRGQNISHPPRAFDSTLSELALGALSDGEVRSQPAGSAASGPFLHLLHLWYCLNVPPPPRERLSGRKATTLHGLRGMSFTAADDPQEAMKHHFWTLPNVTGLKEAGVRFKVRRQPNVTRPTEAGVKEVGVKEASVAEADVKEASVKEAGGGVAKATVRFAICQLNVTRRKEADVRFTVRDDSANTHLITPKWDMEVTFDDGTLKMPRLHLNNFYNTRLRNLITFEQCYPENGNYRCTSFAYLMDRLIDTEKDVESLVESGIVFNTLGSCLEAATFFNELNKGANFEDHFYYFGDLFVKVNEHCVSGWHKRRAILMRDYFGNPWSGFSVGAAAVLLLLTVTQTIYALLSYHTA